MPGLPNVWYLALYFHIFQHGFCCQVAFLSKITMLFCYIIKCHGVFQRGCVSVFFSFPVLWYQKFCEFFLKVANLFNFISEKKIPFFPPFLFCRWNLFFEKQISLVFSILLTWPKSTVIMITATLFFLVLGEGVF